MAIYKTKFFFVIVDENNHIHRDSSGDFALFESTQEANLTIQKLTGVKIVDLPDGHKFKHKGKEYTKLCHDNMHSYIPAFDDKFKMQKFDLNLVVTPLQRTN